MDFGLKQCLKYKNTHEIIQSHAKSQKQRPVLCVCKSSKTFLVFPISRGDGLDEDGDERVHHQKKRRGSFGTCIPNNLRMNEHQTETTIQNAKKDTINFRHCFLN